MLMTERLIDDREVEGSLRASLAQRLRAVAERYKEIAELHRLLAEHHERQGRAGAAGRDPEA